MANELILKPPSSGVTATVGRTGRRNRLRNVGIDDPLLQEMRGTRAIRTIDRMMIDPVVGGMIERSSLLLRSPEWRMEPRSNDAIDQEFAEYVQANFEGLEGGWKSVLAEASEMIAFGFQPFEVLFQQDGSFVRWGGFSYRDPRTIEDWDIDESTGRLIHMVQRTDAGGIAKIPAWKLINLQTRSTPGRPWGRTMLRAAFIPWTDKQELRRIIKVGVRRDLTGLAKLQVPPELLEPNATEAQKVALAAAELMVREVERDEREGLVVPAEQDARGQETGYKFELVSSGGRRQLDLEGLQMFYNREIAIALMFEFALLGQEERGSYAMHSDKTSMFTLAVNSILDAIAEHMERYPIPVLRALNPRYMNARIPRVRHSDIEEVAIKDFAQAVSQLINAGGIIPDRGLDRALRRRVQLPEAEGEEALT